MKLIRQMNSKVTKHMKQTFKKLSKALAKRGMHLEVSRYENMFDVYLMMLNVGIHMSISRKPSCLFSFTIGLDNISLMLVNMTLSVTYLHY